VSVPPTCTRNKDGQCAWNPPRCNFVCPTVACTTGVCPYGSKIDPNGCMTCECNPAPICTDAECGPGPKTPTMICPDGSTAGPVCGRDAASGKCGWTITMCPNTCPIIECLRACPNGSRKDEKGCDTCDCLSANDCATRGDYASCQADMRCTWLVPGCGTPALATQGCYARTDLGCMTQRDCSGGRACLTRVVNPCGGPDGGAACAACGLQQTICL